MQKVHLRLMFSTQKCLPKLPVGVFGVGHLGSAVFYLVCLIVDMPSFQIAHKLGILYSEMIFVNGYVHCDPHPGNILVRRSPKRGVEIVFLDHGLYQVRPLIPLLHPK